MTTTEDHEVDRATISHLRIATRELVLFIRSDTTDVLMNEPGEDDAGPGDGTLRRWASALRAEGWEIDRTGPNSVGLTRAHRPARAPNGRDLQSEPQDERLGA